MCTRNLTTEFAKFIKVNVSIMKTYTYLFSLLGEQKIYLRIFNNYFLNSKYNCVTFIGSSTENIYEVSQKFFDYKHVEGKIFTHRYTYFILKCM